MLHFSVNQLTLFGMVLAIGIVVDDAIVVIENVERIMTEEHLEPRAATRKAMQQITGAIIAITVVLTAVFVPSALQAGATGIIYAQFALTIAVSMGFPRSSRCHSRRRCARRCSGRSTTKAGTCCSAGSIGPSTAPRTCTRATSAAPSDTHRVG